MTGQVRRWPLFLIAAPAAVAVWSGWVGLGTLCGFGIIHPLPGIVPGFALNTAITLPIGVEAYGAYALGAWLAPLTVPEVARRFAKQSAIGALALGMTGQVVYHLLAAAHASHAPWPVVVLVSCMPVVTLGFGAALTHLLRGRPAEPETARRGVLGQGVEARPAIAPGIDRRHAQRPSGKRAPKRPNRRAEPATAHEAELAFSAVLAEGHVPSLRQVKSEMHVGTDRARVLRDHLAQLQLAPVGGGQDD
jgi:hypothetical protein